MTQELLGKIWEDVYPQLIADKIKFRSEITHPSGRAMVCGNLRIARVTQSQQELVFLLVYDRFKRE